MITDTTRNANTEIDAIAANGSESIMYYYSVLLALSTFEVVAILLSLIGGVLYLTKSFSWDLLVRQTVLIPLLLGYAIYIVVPTLPKTYLLGVYHSALFATSCIVIDLGIAHRHALRWAFFEKTEYVPPIQSIRLRDVVFTAMLAMCMFAICVTVYVFVVNRLFYSSHNVLMD